MTLSQLIVCLVIAVASGAIMRAIVGRSRGWVLASAILGFAGALMGAATGRLMRLSDLLAIDSFQILWPVVGSILFVLWGIAAQVLVSSFAARPWALAPSETSS